MDKEKKLDYIYEKLSEFRNPLILEFGVNKGGSTKMFLRFLEKNPGSIYSIDINDCSHASNSLKWNFFQSNDLDYFKIIEKFPEIKNRGIDILYIDSYHDPSHVKLLLSKWFSLINKNGYIFFDDTESLPYRLKKNFTLSVINDEIDLVVRNFYYQNYEQLTYVKYYIGTGLSIFKKKSIVGSMPARNKIWKYTFIFGKIYILVKNILYRYRSKHL